MNRISKNPFYCYNFPLFNVVTLLLVTYFIVHFAQLDPNETVPSMKNFQVTEVDKEPTPKPLPLYNYSSLPICDYSGEIKNPRLNVTEVAKWFHECVDSLFYRFAHWPEGIITNWQTFMSVCDEQPFVMDVELRDIGAESWAILPACQEKNTLVVMGVRNNTQDIDHLLEKIPNLETYGTDPFLTESLNIKSFFNFALTRFDFDLTHKPNTTMEYAGVKKTVPSKGINEFFENDLKLKVIDMLHINPTYGTFPYWDYTMAEGQFKKMGITVCQMMIEVPKSKEREWLTMIGSLPKKSDFIFMRPRNLPDGSARAFFVNVEDPRCRRKYFD